MVRAPAREEGKEDVGSEEVEESSEEGRKEECLGILLVSEGIF